MIFYTDTKGPPWTVVKSDGKKRARLNVIRHVLATAEYANKDHNIACKPDPLIIEIADTTYEIDGRHIDCAPLEMEE